MPANPKRLGYESVLCIGDAGAQVAVNGSTRVICATDIDYSNEVEYGETTCRGEGTSVPIKTERVSCIHAEISFKMLKKNNDGVLQALLLAARTGAPVGVWYKDYTGGYGYNGDMNVKVKHNAPLKSEQTFEFTMTANDDWRTPVLNLQASET